MEQASGSVPIKFKAPRPIREILDRNVRALGVRRGEYLRTLILNDDRARRQSPEKQK